MAKILIIDDEASIRETLANILRDEGLVVTIGGRGTFVLPAGAQAGQ